MAFSPFPFSDFGGLELRSDVDDSGCIDLLNVDFDKVGSVRSRDGYLKFTASQGTNRYDSLAAFYKTDGTKQLVAAAGARIEALDTTGAITGTPVTTATASPHFFARVGTPTAEYMYIANGNEKLRRWDGATFTQPAFGGASITGKYLAVQPADNRLVNARFSSASQRSRVHFSAAGDPETWDTTNDYIDLQPGDGEEITGMVSWRDLLIVFKESAFFSFYGNSVDSTGGPVFNYRPVIGAGLAASRGVAVSPRGVFFVNRRGVYLTTGQEAQLVSRQIDPIFLGNTSPFFASSPLNQAQISLCVMAWVNERLYLAYPSGSSTVNDRLLVFDPDAGFWTLWDLPVAAIASFRVAGAEDLMFAYASGTKDVGRFRFDTPAVDDAGVGITSRWRSGFTPLNWMRRSGRWLPISSQEAGVRESIIDGTGTIRFSLSRDFGAVPTTGGGARASVALGTSPAVEQGRHLHAQRGRRVSFQIEDGGAGAPWRVYGLTLHIDGARDPGAETE